MSFFWPELDEDDEFAQHERCGEAQCDRCGEWWPVSHMETDSGDCITCEDMDDLEREDED